MRQIILSILCGLAGLASDHTSCTAAELANLVPDSAAIYIEVPASTDVVDFLRGPTTRRLTEQLSSLPAVSKWSKSQQAAEIELLIKVLEAEWEMKWPDAFRLISEKGFAFAADPATDSAALLFRAQDQEALERIVMPMIETADLEARSRGQDQAFERSTYQDAAIFKAKDFALAIAGDLLLIVNKSDFGQEILDLRFSEDRENLAASESFQSAKSIDSPDAALTFFLDLDKVRGLDSEEKSFDRESNDVGRELILGGMSSLFPKAPFLTGELRREEMRFQARFTLPMDRQQAAKERGHFFGPEGRGSAPELIQTPGTILAISAYRDLAQMWQRAQELFPQHEFKKLKQADKGLSTLFGGRDFGEDVLGAIEPELQLVIAKQTFSEQAQTPEIKLPAIALVARVRNPELVRKEFRRNFINMIGFFNIAGAAKGQPQLEFEFRSIDNGELIKTEFVNPATADGSNDELIYNFTPAMAFTEDRMILSSRAALAESLAAQTTRQPSQQNGRGRVDNTRIRFDISETVDLLEQNRDKLVERAARKRDLTSEEAGLEFDQLITLLESISNLQASLSTTDSTLELTFEATLESAEAK